jgi:hypothetical protein
MKIYIECGALGPYMGVVHAQIDEGINQVTTIDLAPCRPHRVQPRRRSGTECRGDQGSLLSAVTMQQQQIKALRNRMADLETAVSASGSGIIAGEIAKDGRVTDGYELVCMVKTEEFERPVVVKTATPWHDKIDSGRRCPDQLSSRSLNRRAISSRPTHRCALFCPPRYQTDKAPPRSETSSLGVNGCSFRVIVAPTNFEEALAVIQAPLAKVAKREKRAAAAEVRAEAAEPGSKNSRNSSPGTQESPPLWLHRFVKNRQMMQPLEGRATWARTNGTHQTGQSGEHIRCLWIEVAHPLLGKADGRKAASAGFHNSNERKVRTT